MHYNFLLVSWGTSGNLSPLLTAGRQLRRNGHRVRVMADPAMRDEVVAADFAFVTWRRAPIGDAADPADVSDMNDWLRRAIFEPAVAYGADVRDEIGRAPTDAVVSIDLLFGAALGAEAAGTPIAMLSPHVSLRPLPGVPPAGSGLSQPRTPQERAAVAAAADQVSNLFNRFLPTLNEARVCMGLTGWTMSWICSIGPTEFCSRLARRSTFRPTLCRIMSGMLGRCSTSRAGRKLGKRPGAIDRIFLAHSSLAALEPKASAICFSG
jgi:hypothetical protein